MPLPEDLCAHLLELLAAVEQVSLHERAAVLGYVKEVILTGQSDPAARPQLWQAPDGTAHVSFPAEDTHHEA